MSNEKKTTKTGGRTKGTPNKTTQAVKEKIQFFVDETIDDFIKMWKQLDNRDPLKFNVFLQLLKMVVPPARPVETEENTTQSVIQKTIVDLNRSSECKVI